MRSGKSFFNKTLFRSNIQRFWPLWLGYFVIWLLVLPLNLFPLGVAVQDVRYAGDVSLIFRKTRDLFAAAGYGGLTMGAIFGIFFAMALFSHLTNARATTGIHALPLRRENLFITQYVSGFIFQVSAIVLAVLLTYLAALPYFAFDLSVIVKALLMPVFGVLLFYSLGALCMIVTGQILAAPVFYGVLNFVTVVLEILVRSFAGQFLYGYYEYGDMVSPLTRTLSPVVELATRLDVTYQFGEVDPVTNITPVLGVELEGFGCFAIYAAVGVAIAALALLLYRGRHSEQTGNTVVFPWARGVFKYGLALGSALSLGQMMYYVIFAGGTTVYANGYSEGSLIGVLLSLVLMGLVGYYAAEMLLKKSFRVFKSGKLGAVIVSAVLIVFGIGVFTDVLGYETYVPDASEVVCAEAETWYGAPYYGASVLYEEESIAQMQELHRAYIGTGRELSRERRDIWETQGIIVCDGELRVTYRLKDGRTVSRRYSVPLLQEDLNEPDSIASKMTTLINSPEVRFCRMTGGVRTEERRILGAYCYGSVFANGEYDHSVDFSLGGKEANRLYDALVLDYAEGNGGQESLFDTQFDESKQRVYNVDFETEWIVTPDSTLPLANHSRTVLVSEAFPRAFAVLQELEAVQEVGYSERGEK